MFFWFFEVFFLSCPEKEHKVWCNDLHESEKGSREMETPSVLMLYLCALFGDVWQSNNYIITLFS